MVRRRRIDWLSAPSSSLVDEVRRLRLPLRDARDLDPLLDRIGEARFVLLGEASHGTSEFYTWRQTISQRLIEEKGFSFIAVEGDWPDCYRVNRYIKGYGDSGDSAHQVLHAFDRWPTWMWANDEVVSLAHWLRRRNEGCPAEKKVGFYGLDVYSLWDSMQAVLDYLQRVDGSAAKAAQRAFECFEPFGEDAQRYARATLWVPDTCEDEVVQLLTDLRSKGSRYHQDGREDYFNAEQNALVAKNAENYYRTMVHGSSESWNVRDRHMVESLNRLMDHHGPGAKAIVWEHNTHIGDARATDMADDGMLNVGQLVREQNPPQDVVLVGFSSYRGSVIAASAWGAPIERMPMPEAAPGSWEALLHEAEPADGLLLLDRSSLSEEFNQLRGHRAIGVVYRPHYEAPGNYVPTRMADRYDAVLYLDETRALRPLHLEEHGGHDVPETYPSGV
jgi:erythromycin esterase